MMLECYCLRALPFSLPSFLSIPLPFLHFPPLPRPWVSDLGSMKLPQRVRADSGRQTTSGAFGLEKELSVLDREICKTEADFYGCLSTHIIFPTGASAAKHPRSWHLWALYETLQGQTLTRCCDRKLGDRMSWVPDFLPSVAPR